MILIYCLKIHAKPLKGGTQCLFLEDMANGRGHSVVSVGDAKEIAGDPGAG